MLILMLMAALSGPQTTANPAAQPLDGAWTVDLSTDPAQPYTKPMHLTLAADGTVSGDFYESTIEAGRWKAQHGRLCVSFRTTDGVGPYHTAACLAGDHVEGQTWAEHRNFVFVWNATRPTP
ncbi:hypothetical protein [Brevundimonas goettingensis]|uniref:hypothetical protein n=1 Tax=Brevundimonas goettingensis TaxID=2774190 RepID=UPI001A9F6273|nr:hypothetical protein [Brevundimonas goettingensis]